MDSLQESVYFDLAKKYNQFEYESLTGQPQPQLNFLVMNPLELDKENVSIGVNQNSYTFLQEKDLLLFDITNIAEFVRIYKMSQINPKTLILHTDEKIQTLEKKFPFWLVKNRITFIIQKYQEQPALLDPIVETLVQSIMGLVESYLFMLVQAAPIHSKIVQEIHHIVSIVATLCKVRGFKYIAKFFPHEVKDLEPVVYFLVKHRNDDANYWETKYIFLLWLSIIVLVPFPLNTIDSKLTAMDQSNQGNIYDNLLNVAKFYLNSTTKVKDAASIFVAKFFSRPDIQKTDLLNQYIDWACKTIKDLQNDPFHGFFITGLYSSIVEILKIGQRNELLDKIPKIFRLIKDEDEMEIEDNPTSKKNTKNTNEIVSLRLFRSKLAQRIGLVYLRPRINTWAYKRSSNSLLENFKKTGDKSKLQTNVVNKLTQNTKTSFMEIETSIINQIQRQDDDEYLADVDPEHLEAIIDIFIVSLRDKDTVVRWSAAKGIGRITQRLDQEMADEIVNSLLSLFSPHEGDSAWHGGCLALAELSRRGLLLPHRLKDIFPVLFKALIFDLNQGNYSVGAHVRDSACYVAWAFARAYDPEIIKDYMLSLAQTLLIVALYDREINCRRAASASFQEHVGRQGNFPHGIDILTEADYFTLGIRNNAYLNVSIYVAQFEEYFSCFADHLANIKIKNWDSEVRRLSAATLSLLTPLNPKYIIESILPKLIDLCMSESVIIRHGAIYGVSEILIGLAGKSELHNCSNMMKNSIFLKSLSKNERKLAKAGEYRKAYQEKYEKHRYINNLHLLNDKLIKDIVEIVSKVEKARLYRGKGGEIMRNGVCRLIECVSYAGLKLSDLQLKRYMDTIEDCLKNPIIDIQDAGEKALRAFSERYHLNNKKEINAFVEKFLSTAHKDSNVAVTRGFTRGIANFSTPIIKAYWKKIFEVLENNCKIKSKEIDDADTRKYAIEAFDKIVEKLLEDENLHIKPNVSNEEINIEEKDNTQILTNEDLQKIFKICFNLCNDYTADKRGDIGLIVREASMYTMLNLIKNLSKKYAINPDFYIRLDSNTIHIAIALILQQLVEKIDKIRLVAGSILQEITDNYMKFLPDFPHKAEIIKIFCKESVEKYMKQEHNRLNQDYSLIEELKGKSYSSISTQNVDQQTGEVILNNPDGFVFYWNMPHCVFPLITPLLQFPEYSYYILKGLCISVGGISESILKAAYTSLKSYISDLNNRMDKDILIKDLFDKIINILIDNPNDERIIIPMLKTIDHIFDSEIINKESSLIESHIEKLYNIILKETKGSKSLLKISASVGVMIKLLHFRVSSLSKKVLEYIPTVLFHKFPKIRKETSDRFYLLLMTCGEEFFGEETTEKMNDVLTENEWLDLEGNDLNDLKPTVQELLNEIISKVQA